MVDSERAHLFRSLVRLAASYEEALALIDKVLGAQAALVAPGNWRLRVPRRRRIARSSRRCDCGLTRCLMEAHLTH